MGKVAQAMAMLVMLVLICPTDDHDDHGGLLRIGVAERTRIRIRVRAIIYARGTRPQIHEQIDDCNRMCAERGYRVVAIATDRPGRTNGWEDANRLHRRGFADVIVLASVLHAPDYLESIDGELPGPPLRRARRPVERHRRTRPLRREDGEE